MFKKTLLDTVEVWRESFCPLIDTTLTALLFGVCLASGLETARWLNDDLFFHQAWYLSVLLPIVIGILVSAICKKGLTSDHEVVKGEMPVVCKKWLTGVILNMCRSVQNRVEHAVVALRSNSLPGG